VCRPWVFEAPAAFAMGVLIPGTPPVMVITVLTNQNEAIRARICSDFQATQRVESLTGAG